MRVHYKIIIILLVGFIPPMCGAEESTNNHRTLTPISVLLEKLPQVASSGTGMNKEEQDFSEELARHGGAAVDPLIALLKTKDADTYQLVTYCLTELNKDAFEPRHLKPMAAAARLKRSWLPNAIADIGTDEAAVFLAKDFRRLPQIQAQIDNALVRIAPRSIAPLLQELRQSSEKETSFLIGLVSVFYTCGAKASSAVNPLLKDQNWQIACSAALSLTQLKAKASRPSLEHCHKHHWNPRVRYAAGFALRRIAGEKETKADSGHLGYVFNSKGLEFAYRPFNFLDEKTPPLKNTDRFTRQTPERKQNKIQHPLYFSLPQNKTLAKALQLKKTEFRSLETHHPKIYQALTEGAPESVEHWKKHVYYGARVTDMIKESDTLLLTINGGEQGSGLFIIEEGKKAKTIFKGFNIQIIRWNKELIVLSGLSHMGMDYGNVHRIIHEGEKWRTQFLYPLPGCPQTSFILTDGRLFANCEGGAVAISQAGEFEYLGSGEPHPPQMPFTF